MCDAKGRVLDARLEHPVRREATQMFSKKCKKANRMESHWDARCTNAGIFYDGFSKNPSDHHRWVAAVFSQLSEQFN